MSAMSLLLSASRMPEFLTILCQADGRAQEGLLVSLSLLMSRKNHFNMVFGPSGNSGQISVSRAEINDEVEHALELFPMDYDDLDSFTGEIAVTPMDCQQIESALRAF